MSRCWCTISTRVDVKRTKGLTDGPTPGKMARAARVGEAVEKRACAIHCVPLTKELELARARGRLTEWLTVAIPRRPERHALLRDVDVRAMLRQKHRSLGGPCKCIACECPSGIECWERRTNVGGVVRHTLGNEGPISRYKGSRPAVGLAWAATAKERALASRRTNVRVDKPRLL